MAFDQPDTTFVVVLNHEAQYAIWPDYKAIPAGWTADGTRGTKAECLAHIERVWTDMRPLSLRRHMAEAEGRAAAPN